MEIAQLASRCRHRLERRLVVLGAVAAILAWLVGIVIVTIVLVVMQNSIDGVKDGISWEEISTPLFLVFLPLMNIGYRLWMRRNTRLSGVELDETQLPGIRDYLLDLCSLLKIDNPPRLILVTRSGPLSDSHGGGDGSILVHFDLFEISRDNGDLAPLRFAIARELGRFAAGHHTRGHTLATMLPMATPVFKGFISRTESYTADRWGAVLAPDAAGEFLTLTSGSKVLWQYLDADGVAEQASDVEPLDFIAVAASDNIPVTWRAALLLDVFATPRIPENQKLTYQDSTVEFPTLQELVAANTDGTPPSRGILRAPL